jgi:uncharacterized protein (TIGR03435 family)
MQHGINIVVLVVSAIATAVMPAAAQAPPAQKPQFEVASVKPSKSVDTTGGRSNLDQRGDNVIITKFSLRMLIAQAYDLPSLSEASDRIFGAPNWADSEHFDIEAKAEGNPGKSRKHLMLRSLLADRFKLAIHQENRQRPVYALVMIKTGRLGPQLHVYTDDTACKAFSAEGTETRPVQASAGARPTLTPYAAAASALQQFPCGQVVGGLLLGDPNEAWSGGRAVTMEMIAAALGGMEPFDRPILDTTSDSRTFDFTVEWHTRLQTLLTTPSIDPSGVTLLEAIRDELGLKLVPQTGPVEVLVIDSVQRPSEN